MTQMDQINILVVGDWTIDQNWICGVQRSSFSSRTGRMHLRGLNEREGATETLCGAGSTASILHRALAAKNMPIGFNITGLGIWHEGDTNLLTDMIHSASERKLQPSGQYSRLTPARNLDNESVRLVNLAEIYGSQKEAGTTRIVRIYQHTGSKVDLLSRVDWESPLSPQDDESFFVELKDRLEKYKPFHAVVIKSLNKKVISPALIRFLINYEKTKELPWYISAKDLASKDCKPAWFGDLKVVNCRMLLIPQMAVEATKRVKETPTKWINNKGFGTQDALEEINYFRNFFNNSNSEKPVVVVLPSGHRILSVGRGKNPAGHKIDDLLIVQNEQDTFTKPMAIETPFASIFFGAYIVQDLYFQNESTSEKEIDTRKLLERALDVTRDYIQSENNRVMKPEDWDPKKDEVYFDMSRQEIPDGKFDWKYNTSLGAAIKRWEDATSGLGIIEREGFNFKFLELFRAATEVDDYICLDPEKRKLFRSLIIELKRFKTGISGRSCSCMIYAPPGTGKTNLAHKLAKAEGYNFLEFNLTHLYAREQLLDVFDRISTEQAKKPDGPLLIFIDEINAQLNHDNFYSAFLTPLDDGTYVRAEKIFHINPCFWLFAGTETKDDDGSHKDTKEDWSARNKYSDLISRLTLPEIKLRATQPEIKGREIVYTGASILVSAFPDVRWVSKKVLTLFYMLGYIPDLRTRELVQFIRSFYDIQRGRVTSANVDIERLKMLFKVWAEADSKPQWEAAKQLKIIDTCPKGTNIECWREILEGSLIKIEL